MRLKGLIVLAGVMTAVPTTVFAYIDPGTGSMALQALLAIVAGVAVALKAYWHKVQQVFGFLRRDKEVQRG